MSPSLATGWESGSGSNGPFSTRGLIGKQDLIDLVQGKPRDFNRGFGQNQFFNFGFELIEAPFSFFAEAVESKSENPLLNLVEVLDPDAWGPGERQ